MLRAVVCVFSLAVQLVGPGAASAEHPPVEVANEAKSERPQVGARVVHRCSDGSFAGVPGHCLTGPAARTPIELRDVRAFGEREVLPGRSPLGQQAFGLSVKQARGKR